MRSRSSRFAANLAWNGVSFAASLVSGFILSPLVVKGLGIEAYGVWALVFSVLDYLGIADLGIRSATVKYVAQYHERGDTRRLHGILNASIVYFLGVAVLAATAVFFLAEYSIGWFRVPENLRREYVLLLRLTGITMAFQLLFNVGRAAMEGFQDFGTLSRINITVNALRMAFCLLALHWRSGLEGLGWATVVSIWCGFALLIFFFRRRLPAFRPSFSVFDGELFRQLLHYGLPTLLGSLAGQFLHNGPVILLGIWKDAASVGYYSLVLRLLASCYELISQAGSVTTSATAQLAAQDNIQAMERTVRYLNRYTFMLFLFVAVFLLVFGRSLFTLWVGPEIAERCLPLIPWLVFGYTFGAAAHQNSIATLFGMGEHRGYNFGLVAEAGVLLVGWWIFLPTQPLAFAAAWWAISFFLNRGLRPSWIVSRAIGISFLALLRDIHIRPLVAAGFTAGLAVAMLYAFNPDSWWGLAWMAACLGLLHLLLLYAFVLWPQHRELIWNMRPGFLRRGMLA